MSQSLAGTFTNLGQKIKDKARRRPKPGPEWQHPIWMARFQIFYTGSICAMTFHSGMSGGSPSSMAASAYNAYLFLKGLRNYQVTLQSAEEAPLRELLGANAPANDNLLTPNQSLSNSNILTSRSAYSIAADHLAMIAFDAATYGVNNTITSFTRPMTILMNAGLGRFWQVMSKQKGPHKLPPLLTRKKPPTSGGPS